MIDANGQPLGRVAVESAKLLRGKHKPIFTRHVDTGDFVIVINAAELVLTGRKAGRPEDAVRHLEAAVRPVRGVGRSD